MPNKAPEAAPSRFAAKMRRERKRRRLGTWQAAKLLGLNPNVLRTLEGSNPDRKPSPRAVKMVTAVSIMAGYWPAFGFQDFGIVSEFVVCRRDEDGFLEEPTL